MGKKKCLKLQMPEMPEIEEKAVSRERRAEGTMLSNE
jgi:hypothetical protein